MIRLFQIDWLKLRSYRAFWVLSAMYLFVISFLPISILEFMKWLESQGVKFEQWSPRNIPIVHFPDVWQNMAYIAVFFKFFIAVLVIILITNEYSYKTIRQNIIDGMSRLDFLKSKIISLTILCLSASIFLFVLCLAAGLIYTPHLIIGEIFENSEFIFGYFLDILFFSMFALLVGNLFKKAGLSIALIVMIIPIEYIITSNLPESISVIADYFPMHVMNSLIKLPFPKYILMEIQDYLSLSSVALCIAYIALFAYLNYLILKKRDLTN